MTITVLKPDPPTHCRPFYIAQQLQTAAWGHGDTETEARARMCEHPKYKPEAEPEVYEAACDLLEPIYDWLERPGRHYRVGSEVCLTLDQAVEVLIELARC